MRAVAVVLLLAGVSRAGLYNFEDPQPDVHLDQLPAYIKGLRGAAAEPKGALAEGSPRLRYQQLARAGEELVSAGTATTINRVNLAGCYIRLGQPAKARAVLKDADQDHFLVQANLAMSHLADENYREARICQEKVLSLWPRTFVAWQGRLDLNDYYRVCERALLRVIVSREEESLRAMPAEGRPIDPIFPSFRLERPGTPKDDEDPSGYYAPGEMPLDVFDRLPPNALHILRQLLVWWPHDLRLWWQTAEVLAAAGHVELAWLMLDDFFRDPPNYRHLRRHCSIVKRSAEAFKVFRPTEGRGALLAVGYLMPAPAWLPPGPGGAASRILAAAAVASPEAAKAWHEWEEEQRKPRDPVGPQVNQQVVFPFNWRHIAVSFVFGVIVAALLGLQWWEMRRRADAAARA